MDTEKDIGGFFSLELQKGNNYHSTLALNTGRSALEYIIRAKKIKTLWIPKYICDAVQEKCNQLNIKTKAYDLTPQFEPIVEREKDEWLMFVNFFGVCDNVLDTLKGNIIVNNAQAFYSKPVKDHPTFYSCRKFFGVPDGSYVYCNEKVDVHLKDKSYMNCHYLLDRLDLSSDLVYPWFREADDHIGRKPFSRMSKLTTALMNSIDYEGVRKKRIESYNMYYDAFSEINELNLVKDVPAMYYPLLLKNIHGLNDYLDHHKIRRTRGWDVSDRVERTSWEYHLSCNLVLLPTIQTTCRKDIENVIKVVQKYLLNIKKKKCKFSVDNE